MAPFDAVAANPAVAAVAEAAMGDSFTLERQQLELDVSFAPRQVKGRTTLTIVPDTPQLRQIVLHCRQLTPTRITLDGEIAAFFYANLHHHLTLYPGSGLPQYHMVRNRIKRHTEDREDELVIVVPHRLALRPRQPADATADESPADGYAPLRLEIEFELTDFRDALHFVGLEDGDARFPHAYTRNSPFPGSASCLFPCIDDGEQRTLFELSIRYPRTLGDALTKTPLAVPATDKTDSIMLDADQVDLCAEDRAIEMQVVCSGTLTDDVRVGLLSPAHMPELTRSRLWTRRMPRARRPRSTAARIPFSPSTLASSSAPSSTSTCPNTAIRSTTSAWVKTQLKCTPFVCRARKMRSATAA